MRIHAIVAIEDVDRQGETFLIRGCDPRALAGDRGLITHGGWPVGRITAAYKVLAPADATTDHARALLDVARGRPFVAIEGHIHNATEREYLGQLMDRGHPIYVGVEGLVLKRAGNILAETVLHRCQIGAAAAHPAYRVFRG